MSLISKINEIKNTEQMNCPHCAVMALFNFSSPKETRNIEIRDAFCQGCGEVIVQIRKVNCELIPRGPLGGLTNLKSHEKWHGVAKGTSYMYRRKNSYRDQEGPQ